MARFEFEGIEEVESLLMRLENAHNVSGNADIGQLLSEAGELLSEYFRGALAGVIKGIRNTGILIDSIKPTAPKGEGNNGQCVDVFPYGAHERNKKASTVGYFLEVGTSNPKRPAHHWCSNTVDDVGDEIATFLAEGVSQIIDKELGG